MQKVLGTAVRQVGSRLLDDRLRVVEKVEFEVGWLGELRNVGHSGVRACRARV